MEPESPQSCGNTQQSQCEAEPGVRGCNTAKTGKLGAAGCAGKAAAYWWDSRGSHALEIEDANGRGCGSVSRISVWHA